MSIAAKRFLDRDSRFAKSRLFLDVYSLFGGGDNFFITNYLRKSVTISKEYYRNMNNTVTTVRRAKRRIAGTIVLVLALFITKPAAAQNVAVKSNLFHDVTTTANIGAEFRLAPKWTFDLSGDLNPWSFSDSRKFKHWLVQPELRYWTCDTWAGHFFGAHLLGGQFNVGGWDINANLLGTDWRLMKDRRYEGWMAGLGLAYGYAWILGQHWNLEAEAGAGWVHSWYDTYRCAGCGKKIGTDEQHDYFGVTKLAVSLVYLF